MEFHDITMEGSFIIEKLTNLPTWTSADEGRMVYDDTANILYYGSDTGWVATGTSGTSGTSGINGTSGTSGSSGTSGIDGNSGTSGSSGTSGASGTSGSSGSSGTSALGTNQKICQCYNTSSLDVNTVTPVPIPFESEDIKDDIYTHSTSTNTSRVQVDTAGWYLVAYHVVMVSAGGNRDVRFRIRKNGSTYLDRGTTYTTTANASNDDGAADVSVFLQLAQNDYIEIMADRAGTSGTWNTLANTSFISLALVK